MARTYFTVIRTSAGRIVSEVTKAWSANEFVHRVELATYDAIKAQGLLDRPAGAEFAKRCSIMAKGCAVAAQYSRDFVPGPFQGAPIKEHITRDSAVCVAFERR